MTIFNFSNDRALTLLDALLTRGLRTAALLLLTIVALLVIKKVLTAGLAAPLPAAGPRRQRLATLADTLYHLLSLIIWFLALLTILADWSVNIAPLLTGAGLIGLAIGLGAQTLVKDLVAGFFIIWENQYNPGDTVTLAGLTGTVEHITLRTTRLRDNEGNLVTIPNSQIQTVIRQARG